jgi:heme-degrading monooxygenase HmoA
MIARVWRGRTRSEHGDEYVKYVKRTGITAHRATVGNRGSMLLRRETGGETEFYVISFWESLDAVRGFAGEDPEVAVYFPEDEEYLLEFEPNVRHYEVSAYESDS